MKFFIVMMLFAGVAFAQEYDNGGLGSPVISDGGVGTLVVPDHGVGVSIKNEPDTEYNSNRVGGIGRTIESDGGIGKKVGSGAMGTDVDNAYPDTEGKTGGVGYKVPNIMR